MEKINYKGIIYDKSENNKEIFNKKIQSKNTGDMLKNILKKILDVKLSNLEKNSNKHFLMMNLTLSNIKYITNLTTTINKELKRNNNNNIQKSTKIHKFSKSVRKANISNSNLRMKDYTKFPQNHSLTSRRLLKSEKKNNNLIRRFQIESKRINFDCSNKGITLNNINIKNSNLKSPSSLKKFLYNPEINNKSNNINNSSNISKYISTANKSNNQKKVIYHTRNQHSIDTLTSNMTSENSSCYNNNYKISKYKGNSIDQTQTIRKSSKGKKIGLIGRLKRSLDKNNYKNSPNKKRNLIKDEKNKNKGKIGIKNKISPSCKSSKNIGENGKNITNCKKKKTSNINNENIINNLENNWKKEEILINKDPLLIAGMKDLEFIPKELLSINISRDELSMYINKNKDTSFKSNNDKIDNLKDKKEIDFSFKNLSKFENSIFSDNLNNILVYLNKYDIIKLKNCSKDFHSSIINYYIKTTDIEKINFLKKQSNLEIKENEIIQKLDITNLHLNKGSLKAIKLLNDEIFCRLFLEDKIPNKDILLIYKIYFQLINNKEIYNNSNNNIPDKIFWEKCLNYFRMHKGKISELLISNIKENKILLTGENLYKIYKLIENDLYKITTAHFSKLCSTTGLFLFYIKDILDFLGFSNETKFQKNSYFSFLEIIRYLDCKMDILNSFREKTISN